MQYPLQEKIGQPELLVGREKEFRNFGKWLDNIPRKLSKSRVILARRKSGKTAFVQRIFNQLWTANGMVIPFYFDIGENKMWYPDFAIQYYRIFASHYIAFLERDETLVENPLPLENIKEYGRANSIKPFVNDIELFQQNHKVGGGHDQMWWAAYSAPHRLASLTDRRILVILDEFQNITQYIYRDEKGEGSPDDTLAGSFHYHSESKIAPMLVTGSYVGWLLSVIDKYLEAGRLSRVFMSPYLAPEEGLQAVYQYAEVYREPITNQTALQINRLCMADPFFISCVIQSDYQEKDLTREQGVIDTVDYEISDRSSEMSRTWAEYIDLTLQRVNDRNAKSILLHLSKHADRYWTPQELKQTLQLDLEVQEIQRTLLTLVESDVIEQGVADIDFRGLQDGTLNLILRNRFEKEINHFIPDLKQDFQVQIEQLKTDKRRLQGMLNQLAGRFAEHQIANEFRSRKRFRLTTFFSGVTDDRELNVIDVRERFSFQRPDGKGLEIDVLAQSSDHRVVLVEVKKQQVKTGMKAVEDFRDKVGAYCERFPDQVVLTAFLSLGGFTDDARQFCEAQGIGMAESIEYF